MKTGWRSIVIAMFLLTSSVLAFSPVAAQGNPNLSEEVMAKIDPNLLTEIREGSSLVAALRVDWCPDLEPIKFNHDAVVSELKNEAARTQEPILSYLESKGDVTVLNTFWLTNTILIDADVGTIYELAMWTSINEIIDNFEVTIPEDEALDFVVSGNGTTTWNIEKVRAPEVWETLGVTGEGIRVATTDTGVEINHPDLVGTMWTDDPSDLTYPGGWIEFDSYGKIVPGSVPHDTHGHGTATYGLILGDATGPHGAVGMAPGAIGMHALTLPGGGGYWAQVIAGLQWCIDPKDQYNNSAGAPAQVSSHSWGPRGGGYIDELIEPIRNMWYANHFVVASIGNDYEGKSGSPGNIYECVGVGATDIDDYVATFSGGEWVYKTDWTNPPPDWPDRWIKPDLSAPGKDTIVPYPPDTWRSWSGTSFASPHIAGAAVLMLSANPTLDVQEIEDALVETAVWYDHYYPEPPDTRYGWGRIDAFEATSLVKLKYLTVLAEDHLGNPLTTGDVYIDDELIGFTNATFQVSSGTHTVFVNDFWESGKTGYRYGFGYWEDFSTEKNRTIEIVENRTVTAYFAKCWCPGDADGSGVVDDTDLNIVSAAYGSQRGDPNWDSRADLNCDGTVTVFDQRMVAKDYGNVYSYQLTVLAEDQYGSPLATGDVYLDGQLVGYTGSAFTINPGFHKVFVNDFWESETTGYRYGFDHWEDYSVTNPRIILVVEDTTVTAYFAKCWCPGDVDGSGVVDDTDLNIVSGAFGSQRDIGNPWPSNGDWDSRADLNCDGIINIFDLRLVSKNYGNVYE